MSSHVLMELIIRWGVREQVLRAHPQSTLSLSGEMSPVPHRDRTRTMNTCARMNRWMSEFTLTSLWLGRAQDRVQDLGEAKPVPDLLPCHHGCALAWGAQCRERAVPPLQQRPRLARAAI